MNSHLAMGRIRLGNSNPMDKNLARLPYRQRIVAKIHQMFQRQTIQVKTTRV